MDIVVPFRCGPVDSVELRYAMRSWEEMIPGADRVILLGEKPKWFGGLWLDHKQDPAMNGLGCVAEKMEVFLDLHPPMEFLMCNDDFFVLKPWLDVRYHNQRRSAGGGFHAATVERAKFILEQQCLPFEKDFELHVPMKMETEKLKHVLQMYDYRVPTALRTLYGNRWPEVSVGIPDVKMANWMKPDVKWRFWSSSDCFANSSGFISWCKERWPRRSRWEA